MSNIGEASRQNMSLGLDTHCLVTEINESSSAATPG